MRMKLLGLILGSAAFVAVSAGAATLSYSGSLTFQLATLPGAQGFGSGGVTVNGSGAGPIATLAMAGTLGPITASVPVTNNATINSVIFTGMAALGGTPLVGGGPGTMGLVGSAKICLVFATCNAAVVPVALTPTGTAGSVGFGVGGTQVVPGAVAITMQHAAWTIGQPAMTIHTPNSTISAPTLPGGFASPASATDSGVVQLVTISKTFTSLTGAFPELPLIGILQLHLVPEPGTLLLLGSGVVGLAVLGRKRRR